MRFPVNYIGITQGYSNNHKAIDFGWNTNYGGKNVAVYACDDGSIFKIEYQNKGGNVLYIKHSNGLISQYAHLLDNSILFKVGDDVKKGTEVAKMGCTGTACTGEHLHFALFTNPSFSTSINPLLHLEVYDDQKVGGSTLSKYEFQYHDENSSTDVLTEKKYTVKKGDTLTKISQDFYVSIDNILSANINKYPKMTRDYIVTGWILDIPTNLEYTVVKGDTLSKIAKKFNISWQNIYETNKKIIGNNPNLIIPGQKLIIKG